MAPDPTGPYGTEAARKALFQLLDTGTPVLITRGSGDTHLRAVLTPTHALTRQQRAALPTWPAHGLTQARKTLGSLVAQAAAGAPQRLRKRTQDIAVLLPADNDTTPHAAPPTTRPPAHTPAPAPRTRTLTAPAAALDSLTSTPHTPLSYGLPALDKATGGLLPGRLTLIAAAPGTGGSLLAASAARATAVVHGRTVLYAASGLTATDVTCRIASAHAGANYQLLRAGSLDAPPDVHTALEEARHAPLWVDDGHDLDTTAITDTVADIDNLALLVVDRLQTTPDPATPLSGDALPAATRDLMHLAREHHLPVLAAVDTDDPAHLATLRADVVLHLQRDGDTARLTVADTDFGTDPHTTLHLHPDFPHARFLDTPPPAPAPPQPPTPRTKQTNTPATPAAPVTEPPKSRPLTPRSASTDTDIAEQIRNTVDDALKAADGDTDAAITTLTKRAVPDAMSWFDRSRVGGRYEHSSFPPVLDLLQKTGQKSGADAVWEGRLSWKNTAVRTDATPHEVTALDANAAYLAAFKTHLPIGQLSRSDNGEHDPKRSGIHLITPPVWDHTDLPSPLGNRRKAGEVWITEPTLRLLQRCARDGLCDPPAIRESWTSGSTENLLEKLRRTLAEVRREAIERDDHVTTEYLKAAYSKFISTMGESTYNREIRRPDWMHILRSQAFANLWLKARKAHQAGLDVVEVTGTDELHVTGDWRQVFTEGRDLSEMKPKHQYVLGGGEQQ